MSQSCEPRCRAMFLSPCRLSDRFASTAEFGGPFARRRLLAPLVREQA